jgi:hypothetical protein
VAARLRALRPRIDRVGLALRLARGGLFDVLTRRSTPDVVGPIGCVLPQRVVETFLGLPRQGSFAWHRPWHDTPMGPLEAALVRIRLRDLAAATERRRRLHASLAAAIGAWPDASDGNGWGLPLQTRDAVGRAAALRRRGVDAIARELCAVDQAPNARAWERTLLRIALHDDLDAQEVEAIEAAVRATGPRGQCTAPFALTARARSPRPHRRARIRIQPDRR